jgi:long-chain acyl-CoA synthetase
MLTENFVKMIETSLKKHWDLPALSDYQGQPLSYGEVAAQIARLHSIFRKNHVKRGDKIALVGRNSVNWAITYLATVTYGAVIVPILPDFPADNIHQIVNHSDSVFFFTADAIYEKLDESQMPRVDAIFSLTDWRLLHAHKKHVIHSVEKAETDLAAHVQVLTPDSLAFPEIANDALATMMYTSGTTGFSKGVMLPYNSLMANVLFAQTNLPLQPGDRIVSFLPLAHAYGCAFEFLFPFTMGCHITLLGKTPSPKVILEAFQAIHPRLILSIPLVIEKIYRKNVKPVFQKKIVQGLCKVPWCEKLLLRKIRNSLVAAFGGNFIEIIIGGAPLESEVEAFLKKVKFPFTIGYGMTECGPLISYASWETHRPSSAGRKIAYLELKINSDNPSATVGDIMVRGENVMTGYYKNETATKEVLDPDGWLNTGDLGTIDQDGFVYIKGRSKNMILGPSGQNIYPEEIEAQLNNLPFVQESLVLEKNRKLFALVYPDLELADAKRLGEVQLIEKMEANRKILNKRLPAYSTITKIELYPEEFEKTPTRKIKRFLYDISLNDPSRTAKT